MLTRSEFAQDLTAALATRPHAISPKYFYDAEGSRLFDRICELPEYYPTRTELAILARHAGEIAQQIGPDAEIIEFGAGSLRKVRLLLDALKTPRRFVPIDISGEHLAQAAQALRADYAGLDVQPLVAEVWYRLLPESGLEAVDHLQPGLFLGRDLRALADADWEQPTTLATAKRLMRQALAPHLGGRPLVSRELFMNLKEPPRA